MIRSSASLMADDISIRCRVRRSELMTTPDYDDAQEMSCTMRNWEAKKTRQSSFTMQQQNVNSFQASDGVVGTILEGDSHCGPELLLTPLHELSGNRQGGNSPRRRWRTPSRQVQPINNEGAEEKVGHSSHAQCSFSVPINDICVVETCTARKGASAYRIQITTLSLGYFDFDCVSRNGHDILLAFLQACVPVERILDGRIPDVPGIRLTSSTTSCFDNDMDLDVDALTAQHLQGQADRETWMEKMSRRTGKVVSSLSEMSESFCETIVCCQVDRMNEENDVRESPPRPSHSFGKQSHLELDEGSQMYSPDLQEEEEEEDAANKFFEKKRQSKLMLRNCHLPSGLSVEMGPASVRSYE